MNIKALITTLVLGSSTMASADSFSVSASGKVSLGFHASSAPVIVRDHRAPMPAPVEIDPCSTSAAPVAPAAYRPVYQPMPPVWAGPFYSPTNTMIGATGSQYTGWLAHSPLFTQQVDYDGRVVLRQTHATSWFDLTEATRIDSGREFFTIGADNGWFRQLKLQNLGTRGSDIKQIAVEFIDNQGGRKTQVVRLNQRLDAAHPSITIDLDGNFRQIGRIIVYGSTNQGAAYKILAV